MGRFRFWGSAFIAGFLGYPLWGGLPPGIRTMRFINRASSAATVLACTGAASAQWCQPDYPPAGWCGAHLSMGAPRYQYERATDTIRAQWDLLATNLHGWYEPAPDVILPMAKVIELPFRSCTGTTPVAWERSRRCEWIVGGWYLMTNYDVNCTVGPIQESVEAPPAQAGTFWIATEPCPGEPGQTKLVVHTRNLPGGRDSATR